jgi:hypothetical protein
VIVAPVPLIAGVIVLEMLFCDIVVERNAAMRANHLPLC